jgi:hypothetical protein
MALSVPALASGTRWLLRWYSKTCTLGLREGHETEGSGLV